MSNFHRFVAPSYFNAPSLPAGPATTSFEGAAYNLLNVVSGGTGSSGSAFADAAKGSGPNAGTYLVAFGEDATSSNANRGMRALAENTDYLDDLFHRDLAIPVRTVTTTAGGGGVSTIVLPAGTFVGNSGSYPIDMLFSLVDQNDREIIIQASGAEVKVVSITGATIGDGFTTGSVTLNISPSIPSGVQYRMYYASRGNLATLAQDAFSFIRVRGAEEVDADVENTFRQIQGPVSQGIAWNATPTTTLYDLARSGLHERFQQATQRSGIKPALHPVPDALDTNGSGGWYVKQQGAPGIIGYTDNDSGSSSGCTAFDHMLGAVWGVNLGDSPEVDADPGTRYGFTSGFVFFGHRQTAWSESTYLPGLGSFYHGAKHAQDTVDADRLTNLRVGNVVTFNGSPFPSTITLPGTSWFYRDVGGGTLRSSYAKGFDILRVSVGGVIYNLIVTSFTSATVGIVKNVDGSDPSFANGTTGTIVDWISTVGVMSDGINPVRQSATGDTPDVKLDGFIYSAGAISKTTTRIQGQHAKFFAYTDNQAGTALSWGGFSDSINANLTNGGTYREVSSLRGDGGGIIAGSLHITGSAGEVRTLSSGRIVLGDNDYPTFSAARTRTLLLPATSLGLTNSTGTHVPATLNGVRGVRTTGLGQYYLALPRLHNGATLNSVAIYFRPGISHASMPTTGVTLFVFRNDTAPVDGGSQGITEQMGTQVHNLSGITFANYNTHIYKVTANITVGGLIDTSTRYHEILILDEAGGGATVDMNVLAVELNYTVNDMNFQ